MKIGVIGAGTMGQGIAKAFAQVEGNTVALCDIKQEWAENGLAKIKKGYEKLVAKGKMTQEKADAIVAAITPGLKEDLCADCDLVVEAAFEDIFPPGRNGSRGYSRAESQAQRGPAWL